MKTLTTMLYGRKIEVHVPDNAQPQCHFEECDLRGNRALCFMQSYKECPRYQDAKMEVVPVKQWNQL